MHHSSPIARYAEETPAIRLKDYFTGEVEGWGILEDFRGHVLARFSMQMQGQWQGEEGTLKEHFTYQDGSTQAREWQLTLLPENRITGTAADIIGQMQGEMHGNAARLRYVLAVPLKGRTWHFHMDDRLYRLDEQHMFNRARMRKCGVTLASLSCFFRKK